MTYCEGDRRPVEPRILVDNEGNQRSVGGCETCGRVGLLILKGSGLLRVHATESLL